jgi:fumarate hydratase subunit beta
MSRQVRLPIDEREVALLRSGDELELSGAVLTGRDQACARIFSMLQAGRRLPINPQSQLMYFVGPSPAPPGHVIGSAGPTTSGRMNQFIPALLAAGFRGFIGKGNLSIDVKQAIGCYHGVYLGAIGGTGALLSQSIAEVEVVAFPELLSEAIHVMRLEHFPVVVLNDCHGGDLYADAKKGAVTHI